MLSRKNSSIALSLLASALLFAGCIIREGDIDDPDPDPTGNNNTTQSTTTGTGGAGGAGGESAGVGGTGGMGGEGGMGGAGGASACVGPDGSGLDVKSCDNMNITPVPQGSAAKICEPNGGTAGSDPPPGYAVCQHGFEVFNGGPAENLQKCLGNIGVEPANACDPKQVQACVNKMYEATCSVESVTKYCEDNAKLCESVGQTLNAAQCAYELKPFNSVTIGKYEECFNNADPNLSCQQAHDDCYIAQL
jgi:hypothetical protein